MSFQTSNYFFKIHFLTYNGQNTFSLFVFCVFPMLINDEENKVSVSPHICTPVNQDVITVLENLTWELGSYIVFTIFARGANNCGTNISFLDEGMKIKERMD